MSTFGLTTAITYLSVIIGLSVSAAYATTFFMTPYNDLYLTGQSGYDDTDLPYTLAIVECVIAGSTFMVGVLAFTRKPARRAVLVAVIFFIVAVIMSGTFASIRAWNLGIIGDDMERTCSDASLSGCPTTRFEAVHKRDIMFSSPFGGECSFWFWGPSMKARYEGQAEIPGSGLPANDACAGWAQSNGRMCDQNIETYMDFSKPSSYGWRDDTEDITALLADTTGAVTIKKVHNMEIVYQLQQTVASVSNTTIPASERYNSQPTITYCWYWGCSEVCTADRYWVNRWWLYCSSLLTLANMVNVILAAIIWRRTSPEKDLMRLPVSVGVLEPKIEAYIPNQGRRRRIQNPTGLLF